MATKYAPKIDPQELDARMDRAMAKHRELEERDDGGAEDLEQELVGNDAHHGEVPAAKPSNKKPPVLARWARR
jgi:hypothetical protein